MIIHHIIPWIVWFLCSLWMSPVCAGLRELECWYPDRCMGYPPRKQDTVLQNPTSWRKPAVQAFTGLVWEPVAVLKAAAITADWKVGFLPCLRGVWGTAVSSTHGLENTVIQYKFLDFRLFCKQGLQLQEDGCSTGTLLLYLCSGSSDEGEGDHVQWGEVMGLDTVVLPLAQVRGEGLRKAGEW